jgi:hypothetical protein
VVFSTLLHLFSNRYGFSQQKIQAALEKLHSSTVTITETIESGRSTTSQMYSPPWSS